MFLTAPAFIQFIWVRRAYITSGTYFHDTVIRIRKGWPFTYPRPLKLFHLRKSMNKSFLVTRSCTTSIFIYFSNLAGLSSAVRVFSLFFPLLEQMRGRGRQGAGLPPEAPPLGPRPRARRGWGSGRKLRGPVAPRLHLQPHRQVLRLTASLTRIHTYTPQLSCG